MGLPVGARLYVALVLAGQVSCAMGRREPTVVLSRAARDSMSAAFDRSNEHWSELADLNTMERMLGTITVRPSASSSGVCRGCVQSRHRARSRAG